MTGTAAHRNAIPVLWKPLVPLYFAFGANMDVPGMALRCPQSVLAGLAFLDGHRFFISIDGFASVKPEQGAQVHGLLWDLHAADVAALDTYEEVESGLYTRQVHRVVTKRRRIGALIYVGRHEAPGTPYPGYMEEVLTSAQAAALPPAYIAELRQWLPR